MLSLKIVAIAAVMALVPTAATALEPEVYVYRGAGWTGRARMEPFTTLLGRNPAGVLEFAENSDWTAMRNSVRWSAQSWDGTYRMLQAVPMLMSTGTLAQGAAGAYDNEFALLGQTLVDNKQSNAIIRVGWEFNGNWYRWSAANDPDAWVTYYQRIVTAMRAVPGQQFTFVWNPALGEQAIAADRVYPGDAYVDYIGMNVFNQSWRPQDANNPASRWNGLVTQSYGLDWLSGFADEHDKPIVLPEWGTGTRPDGHGGGDDPLFINNMASWIDANDVAIHGYWDYKAGDFDGEISDGGQPLSAAAFRNNFNLDALPEPGTWAMMILGFGLVGGQARRHRATMRFRSAS